MIKQHSRNAFTLLELLVVCSIIAVLMALLQPALTTLKGGNDVTLAAYTVKGVLDTARTFAKANNTYVWVGFYEEKGSTPSTNPATRGFGRVVMSIVASKDGTVMYDPNNPSTSLDPTRLTQIGRLTKIDNVHLWTHTDNPAGTGSTFDTRPAIPTPYCIGDLSPSPSDTYFQYPVGNPAPALQYKFVKAVQFSPGGEARINNNYYSLQPAAEIGLEPMHGSVPPNVTPANMVAIQFTGVGGNVRIYRR